LDPELDKLYAATGRASIASEYVLRALLLQAFYSIRSERQLVGQIDYHLLFGWFVGLGKAYDTKDFIATSRGHCACDQEREGARLEPRPRTFRRPALISFTPTGLPNQLNHQVFRFSIDVEAPGSMKRTLSPTGHSEKGRLVVAMTAVFGSLCDDMEEQLGGDFCQWNVAEFIDDDQLHTGPAGEHAAQVVFALRFYKLVDERSADGEAHSPALTTGCDGQAGGSRALRAS
jgi:hypothetical protein